VAELETDFADANLAADIDRLQKEFQQELATWSFME